jgi:hypothetical protein
MSKTVGHFCRMMFIIKKGVKSEGSTNQVQIILDRCTTDRL